MLMSSNEVSKAKWWVERLWPFNTYQAGSLVPPGFEAYARLLHPADRGMEVRWSEISAWSGRVYHPEMQFEAIATPVPGTDPGEMPWDGQTPDHTLSMKKVETLAELLHDFTKTPAHIWFALCEVHGNIKIEHLPPKRLRVSKNERDYLLYKGPLEAVSEFSGLHMFFDPDDHPPDSWWPEDRSWFVASDIDLFWTYVGGSKACIEAILKHPAFEAVPAELEHKQTIDSDPVNRLSKEELDIWL